MSINVHNWSQEPQLVWQWATDWMARVRFPAEHDIFFTASRRLILGYNRKYLLKTHIPLP